MTDFLYDIAGTYQPGFSVIKAKQEGFIGGISKITEGLTSGTTWDTTNKHWSNIWYQESRDNGQIWGGYHYLRNGNGAAQARYFLDEFNKITGHGVNGHLVQLDNESDADWVTTQDWSNEFYRLTNGHPYLMYTGSWWWNVTGRKWNGNSLTPYLWHSHYVAGTGIASIMYEQVNNSLWTPGYGNWPVATILQFSSKGSAGNINNNVDVNAFRESSFIMHSLTGDTPNNPLITGDEMLLAREGNNGPFYLCNGLVSRPLSADSIGDILYLADQGLVQLGTGKPGPEWDSTGRIRLGWTASRFGDVPTTVVTPTIDYDALSNQVVAKLAPALGDALASSLAARLEQ
jgi:hypothetical protein